MQKFFNWLQEDSQSNSLYRYDATRPIVLNFELIRKCKLENGEVKYIANISERTKATQYVYDFFYDLGLKNLFEKLYDYEKHSGGIKVFYEKYVVLEVYENKDRFEFELSISDFEDDEDEDVIIFKTNDALELTDWFANYYIEKLNLSW